MSRYSLQALLPALLVLGLAACAGGSKRVAQEETAAERAMARAQLVIAGDGAGAWEYFTPGYRAAHSRDVFVRDMPHRPVRWMTAELLREECEEQVNRCQVALRIEYQLRMPIPRVGLMTSVQTIRETWLKLDGRWYLAPADMAG